MSHRAVLALEDGSLFHGRAIGAEGKTVGEVVFNTAMTGYQEILTDPSYASQIITFTYPHIGNVGTNAADFESERVHAAGLVIRDLSMVTSNYRSEQTLGDFLAAQNVVGIADIDTRRLTRILRDKGAQSGCILTAKNPDAAVALAAAKAFPGLAGMDLAKQVSVTKPYEWNEGGWDMAANAYRAAGDAEFHVVAYDFGIKRNILRILVDRGCRVTVVPAQTPADKVLKLKPDGVFLSNGPGDPEPCVYAIKAIGQILKTRMPLFGICLGHQLLALATGAKTVKMKFGHHGANHPVYDLATGRVMISSQNHGFAVDEESLPQVLETTHRSLFDGSLQGVRHKKFPAYSFQGHPEASPGPHDVVGHFGEFIRLMGEHRSQTETAGAQAR
ncbi:MAG: carbamoyl-phosphate synthase small subunit [Gammaproteobacteria bacterium]|nr:MAG: carbamoyl-phosphate synthase small subunit [Gammaproteobacteria bacterium]